ncbi:MAG: GTP 3',8-cyclase MoaA [Dehalococcoidia bacterium]|nr:GTP 3',8-cyclase MoaA [Dehalococcoidia bacterium]
MSQTPGNQRAKGIADTFGRSLRDLRISVTDRCNFRCPYCMPAEIYGEKYEFLPRPHILTFEEIERLAKLFVAAGVSKIRITGGEPLVRVNLPELIAKLSAIEGVDDLALTTNGYLLAQHAGDLKDAGLDRLTVSLDSLDEEIFKTMSGRPQGPARTLEGIRAASDLGFAPIKINVVVQRGVNEHTLVDTARYFRGTGTIVRFIEFMDVGTRNGWELSQVVPATEIRELIGAEFPIEPVAPNSQGEVVSRYRYLDGEGEIGIISSVSEPFCGDCNRARLSTDGKLVTCLFASGGADMKTPMRAGASDDELTAIIGSTWKGRADRYSELRSKNTGFKNTAGDKVEMYYIGG